MDIKQIILGLHPLERKVVPLLKDTVKYEDLVMKSGMQPVEVMRALQWLSNKKLVVLHEELSEVIKLEKNGELYKEKGLPEHRIVSALEKGSLSNSELKSSLGLVDEEIAVTIGILRKSNAIEVKRDNNVLLLSLTEEGKRLIGAKPSERALLTRDFPCKVKDLSAVEKEGFEALKRRKKILKTDVDKRVTVELTREGKKLVDSSLDFGKIHDTLTPALLKSGEWKDADFRRYDVTINVPEISGGRRHFVEQAISYIKHIWLDLGFKEMTGNMVQTAFWNLDALFIPQDHPAREMQDTFYVKNPATGKPCKDMMQKVKAMHEHGGDTDSTGYQYRWSESVAKENLLRTHTTVLSAKALAALKKEGMPAKFFSVGKVFRNEALSWKHLFEFIQVEGIVVDPDANFKNLKGYLTGFFMKMGFDKIRIRPGHFPYVYCAAEVDVWHKGKNQWVELGGSGLFRPEVTVPLLGHEVPVLAWGLGLERSIMEYYEFTDIRDLYNNDIKKLRESKLWLK